MVVICSKESLRQMEYRVRTGPGKPGKSWKIKISKSRPGKPGKMSIGPGKSWKTVFFLFSKIIFS